ncbi:low molecular weight protein tyrosine phosphatase family protein [Microbacterium sp. 22195]|uniref:low molecular weight protein tyrosine phosphatase family protein n=1 Tax=Microbacterium sp. 22195 TaxID=3453891 RepID=UPI003F873458
MFAIDDLRIEVFVMRVLFVCSRNRLRSPTAEQVFRTWPGIEVASAGLKPDADEVLGPEDLEWADLVLVMENKHKRELSRRFMRHLDHVRVAVLGIPDDYDFMDPDLVEILLRRVPPFLTSG